LAADRKDRRALRARAAGHRALPAAPDRRAQPLRLGAGELPAVRGAVLPRAHRPRLPGHRQPGERSARILQRDRSLTMADPSPPQDPFEMFRRLWGPLGVPVPGMTMPTLDPQEIDKRIQELKSVEVWLSMNLNMLRTAIQGLEMQKSGLQAMQQAMNMGINAGTSQDKDKKP